jgi:hypothetical protein
MRWWVAGGWVIGVVGCGPAAVPLAAPRPVPERAESAAELSATAEATPRVEAAPLCAMTMVAPGPTAGLEGLPWVSEDGAMVAAVRMEGHGDHPSSVFELLSPGSERVMWRADAMSDWLGEHLATRRWVRMTALARAEGDFEDNPTMVGGGLVVRYRPPTLSILDEASGRVLHRRAYPQWSAPPGRQRTPCPPTGSYLSEGFVQPDKGVALVGVAYRSAGDVCGRTRDSHHAIRFKP